MKKFLSLLLATALVLIFTACGQTVSIYNNTSDTVNNTESQKEDASSVDTVVSDNTSGEVDATDTTSSEDKTASDNSLQETEVKPLDDKNKTPDTDKTSDNETDKPTDKPQITVSEYTVTFKPDNGDNSFTQKTLGNKVSRPQDPVRTGYDFLGWYIEGGATAWNFDNVITSNTTLTAKWYEQEYTVTFNLGYDNKISTESTVNYKAVEPQDPTRAGYKFLGWYQSDTSTAWNFSNRVTEGIVLTAKWEIQEFKVTFNPNNGDDTFERTTVNHMVSKPQDPEKENGVFSGWYQKGSSVKWDFNTNITNDIVLVAKWEIAGDHGPIILF